MGGQEPKPMRKIKAGFYLNLKEGRFFLIPNKNRSKIRYVTTVETKLSVQEFPSRKMWQKRQSRNQGISIPHKSMIHLLYFFFLFLFFLILDRVPGKNYFNWKEITFPFDEKAEQEAVNQVALFNIYNHGNILHSLVSRVPVSYSKFYFLLYQKRKYF